MAQEKISFAPSIRRFPSYLLIIRQALHRGDQFISGTVIAQELSLEPIQIRKDLAITGIVGKPKKGYPVAALVAAIEHYLGWDSVNKAIVVGSGNLGMALSGYPEFRVHGLEIIGIFDSDPDKIGTTVHGIPVNSIERLEEYIRDQDAQLAIVTVPAKVAQEITDRLVKAGIKALWNFTNVKLKIPSDVVMHREDLSSGYALLSVMLQNKRKQSD